MVLTLEIRFVDMVAPSQSPSSYVLNPVVCIPFCFRNNLQPAQVLINSEW